MSPVRTTPRVRRPVREEWVRVTGWFNRDPGWIPRHIIESLGVDCSPLDSCRIDFRKSQGTVWFTREQSEAIRAHELFELEPPSTQETSK